MWSSKAVGPAHGLADCPRGGSVDGPADDRYGSVSDGERPHWPSVGSGSKRPKLGMDHIGHLQYWAADNLG
jgi:hypothetical protein